MMTYLTSKRFTFFVVTMAQWAQMGGQAPFSKKHDIIDCLTFVIYETQHSDGNKEKTLYYLILKI